jgi:peptidoglycan/xylan/chitin deacetylase (PgdA/CDA1 family)
MANLGATLMVWRGSKTQPLAALTFDDGPTPEYTPGILKALSDADAPATFFMMGKHVVRYPDLARRVAERHEIGNHSYSHPDMSHAADSTARDQLGRTHEAIGRITKKTPTLFRPPYGRFSGAVERVAAEMDYSTILWSERFHPDSTAAKNVVRLGESIDSGFIVLFHDGFNPNNRKIIKALPALMKRVRERGIQLVGMTELLAVVRRESAAATGDTTGRL